jgi:hypothetical protein
MVGSCPYYTTALHIYSCPYYTVHYCSSKLLLSLLHSTLLLSISTPVPTTQYTTALHIYSCPYYTVHYCSPYLLLSLLHYCSPYLLLSLLHSTLLLSICALASTLQPFMSILILLLTLLLLFLHCNILAGGNAIITF